MRTTIILGASVAFLLLGTGVQAASQCKGLNELTCGGTAECRWMPERKAGETKSAKGEVHKASAKAHCRLAPAKSQKS